MAGILAYSLTLSTKGFTAPMGTATRLLGKFGGVAGRTITTVTKLGGAVTALGGAFSVFKAMSKAADFEQLSISMRVLIGDVQETKRVINELRTFSNVTPFEPDDVFRAGKSLIALGGSTKTLTAELRALGDVSAGLGIPLGELATAYGKARIDGVLMMETINQFNDRGIPVIDRLAKMYGKSTTEIRKMASEGKITFPALQKIFSDLTAEGGKFHGMMAAQSVSNKGLLSTLKGALDELLIAIGTPINDFLKPILQKNIGRMQALNLRVSAFLKLLSAAKDQGELGGFLGASLKLGFMEAVNILSAGIRGSVAYLVTALPAAAAEFRQNLLVQDMWLGARLAFKGIGATLTAGILDAAEVIDSMLGEKLISYAKVVNPLFGEKLARKFVGDRGVFAGEAERKRHAAGNYFNSVGNIIKDADFEGGLAQGAAALKKVQEQAEAARAKASNKPVFDTSDERSRLKSYKWLDPDAMKDLLNPVVTGATEAIRSLEQELGGLDTSLANTSEKIEQAGKKVGRVSQGTGSGSAIVPGGAPATRSGGLANLAQSMIKRADRSGISLEDMLKGSSADRTALGGYLEKQGLLKGLDLEDFRNRAGDPTMSTVLADLAIDSAGKRSGGLGGKLINPKRAAARLAQAAGAADPAAARRGAAAEDQRKSATLHSLVASIEKQFSELATA